MVVRYCGLILDLTPSFEIGNFNLFQRSKLDADHFSRSSLD